MERCESEDIALLMERKGMRRLSQEERSRVKSRRQLDFVDSDDSVRKNIATVSRTLDMMTMYDEDERFGCSEIFGYESDVILSSDISSECLSGNKSIQPCVPFFTDEDNH